jgi:hypothetical protein
MTTATALPGNLRDKLTAVAHRIRLWRALRGISLVLLVLVLTGGAALLADAWLDLPAVVRGILLAVWIGLGLQTVLFSLVIPLSRRLDPEALAAVIEARFPHLGERLTTTIELTGTVDEYHGSPTLVALLIDETEARTQRLNFLRAFPAGASGWLAGAAVVALLSAGLPAFLWPERSAELGRRFFFALKKPTKVVPYALVVAPGDAVVARGRPLLLTVQVQPIRDNVALPPSCTLIQTGADGETTRSRMLADRSDAFSLKLDKVPGDFRYHIEAGEVISAAYQITAVEPVELAADSPTITVTPPEYARATIETETVHGGVDLAALQHSRVTFAFRFTRPAGAASLEWKPAKTRDGAKVFPLELAAEKQEGRFELAAGTDGTYKVVLEAEHGIRTELEARGLTVKVDQPPAFIRVSGSEEIKVVRPEEVLPLEVDLADDVGVDLAELEYRVNEGTLVVEAMQLEGRGTRQAKGRHTFQLSGKVKEGDVVRYRFKAADNRRVPVAKLGPNVVYHPPETTPGQPRWRTLKIARQAAPLKQQEIAAQHEEFKQRLESIQKNLRAEQAKLQQVRTDTSNQAVLKPPQAKDLADLRQHHRTVENDLRELARDLAEAPAFQVMAEPVQDIADQEMNRAAKDLQQAQAEGTAQARAGELAKADKELAATDKKLEDLRRQNEQLAQARLAQAQLEALANRQQQLADRAAQQAAADRARAPRNQEGPRELEREQGELAKELQRQGEQNEDLRQALDAARAEQARQMAERSRDLAQAERDLAQAERDREQRQKQEQLADLARQQQELAEKARRLAQETRQPAQAARTKPLQPDEAQKAAEALKGGDAPKALQRQDRAAQELSRLADGLQRGLDLAREPREAARQLARLQEDLRKRLNEEVAQKEAQEPLAKRLEKLQPEQQAIHKVAEQLSVPENNPTLKLDHQEAAQRAGEAAAALQKGNARETDMRMKVAQQALERLASRMPSLEQRQDQALAEVRRLRQEQDQIARQVEKVVKEFDKEDAGAASTQQRLAPRLTEAARRQAEMIRRLERLDTPNQEARRERVQEALDQARTDLTNARPQDVEASQQESRRQLGRLEQALSGKKPADDQARELARKQQNLADEAARLAADPQAARAKQNDWQRRQEQIAQDTQGLNASEAPQRQAEAAAATRRAEESVRKSPADANTPRQMREAAQALEQLARQLEGQETEAERADRLAKRQAELAQSQDPESQRRQQEIAEEAKQLRAGAEGQAEKQRAVQALTRIQQAAKPGEQAQAKRQAADALRNLADRLAGRQDAASQTAELARQQRTLANEAAQDKPPSPTTAKEAADRQAELSRQLERLDARQARAARRETARQMAAAQQALQQAQSPAQAKEPLTRAAEAAEKLARELAKQQTAVQQPQEATPSEALPTPQQTEQARQLAQQQRDLRSAVKRLTNAPAQPPPTPRDNPVAELTRQQQEIAQQTAELSRKVGQDQGPQAQTTQQAQQAARSAQQASNQLQAGALPRAQQSGQQTAQQLRQLTEQLGAKSPEKGNDPGGQARQLAQRQEDINRRLSGLANDRTAQQVQQQARQQDLQRQTGGLMEDLQRLAQQMARTPPAQQAAQRAARFSQQAQTAMQEAQKQQRQANSSQAQQSQQAAAQALDQAARQAEQAAQQMARGQANPQTGQELQKAQGQMSQAQNQLSQGQTQSAQQSMLQAVQALTQAARQVAPSFQPGRPNDTTQENKLGALAPGQPDLRMFDKEMKKYAGKSWGELPGELRTKILQDMKAKYGDDYARIIKLYFEQIADKK